ncbi:hypothetical protein J0X19_10950 [Hymenobacter sp. BT186]|uniref:Lipocalin-like domain-containing protein n=1 Tax=Hymenobacter telluris TaxID=2816474 RepID=A0A939J958_9BACT|nr:hypothetical protein [Hymenobacter telluris]MBO0358464.1 hypothetical protein [Hymenobacter telluris]MBW3374490.1 hypothetical protein [Hymenobacter norwichensis]
MRHLFLVSLLSLAGVLGACKKNDPEPALEGHWTPENSTLYYYDGAGTLTHQEERAGFQYSKMAITKDSLIYRYQNTNVMMLNSGPIIRQGTSSFSFFSFNTTYHVLIKELTDDKLVLRFKITVPPRPTAPGGPYTEHEEIYSR